jgi:hypothetical protein
VADRGYIKQLLNRLETAVKTPLEQAFDHTLTSFRLGQGPKASNFAWYLYSSTTAADANTEFSIAHGQVSAPSKLIPFLDLEQIGSQIVPLTVSRAPDASRVYLKSSSTGAVFSILMEF